MKEPMPRKGEIWMRWNKLVTILDIKDSTHAEIKLVEYMTPDGNIGSTDALSWQEWMDEGTCYPMSERVEK